MALPATPPSTPPCSSRQSSLTAQERAERVLKFIDAQDPPLRSSYSPLSRGSSEQDRLVTQNYVLRTAFDDHDFQATSMQGPLDQGCVAIEIGCGPGTWSMEMSTAFPNSIFIGLDLDTSFPKFIKPQNCYFRACDITQWPLPLPDNSVDFIFHRDMNWTLLSMQWPHLVKEYLRILRPGGWVECMEMEIESKSTRQHEQHLNDHVMHGLSLQGQDPAIARKLPSMLALQGFRRVSSQFQSLPLGWGWAHHGRSSRHPSRRGKPTPPPTSPLKTDGCSEYARAAAGQYRCLLESLRPWLANALSCTPEKYDMLLDRVQTEWVDAHSYINWHAVIAQKPL
ncbi:S-adenosyl-L-methionine-dependent methyltransferase [Hesseltinella vesiculosa]|uniref:S-adenosyl-L-methionine-dependent methyltransferase n=1 Tax=Hesseltinella vesiculosa TaxID=101127 RepID=A0A1X2GRW4_9FUNG|nr:S-adenosyl-L-methionine-dependent methyltransferase [Hesseltinella vesiculosa]